MPPQVHPSPSTTIHYGAGTYTATHNGHTENLRGVPHEVLSVVAGFLCDQHGIKPRQSARKRSRRR